MAAPAKQISTSIGFQDAKGNVVSNGLLRLTLSQTATVTATGGQVSTDAIFLPLDVNGKITTTAIWFVDEFSTLGLIYYGKVYKSDLVGEVPGLNALQYAPNGAGPYDLAVAAQSGPASPSYSQAVLLSPTSQQNGFINISGILNVGNAAAIGTTLAVGTNETVGGTLAVTGATTLAAVSATAATITSLTTGQIIQPAATALTIVDNQGGTRYSIPSGGVAQSTINNTKLTGVSNSNSVTLINFQGPAAAITGTGADATAYTFTVPANTIGSGKGIRVTTAINHSTGTASVTYKLSFGGTAIASYNSAVTGYGRVITDIFNNVGSVTAQSIDNGHLIINTSLVTGGGGSSAIATTSNQAVTFTFNVAATDQVTPIMFRIELLQ